MVAAQSAVVLAELDIEHPMRLILNALVGAQGVRDAARGGAERGEVLAHYAADLVTDVPLRFNHRDAA